jgi:Na+-transporting NADH:ubiquinone oxidoreductase subunit NqrE
MSWIEDLRIELIREDIQKTRKAVKVFLVILPVGIIICAASILFVQFGNWSIFVFVFGLYVTWTSAIVVIESWRENKRLQKVIEGLLLSKERGSEQI